MSNLTPSPPPLSGVLVLINCLLGRGFCMLRAAKLIHCDLLQGVLRAPQGFFESTPTGRLLNRFSKDVDTIDNHIPDNIDIWMRTFWYTLTVLLICSALTPIFLLVIAPLTVFYWWVQVNRTSANSLIQHACLRVCVHGVEVVAVQCSLVSASPVVTAGWGLQGSGASV